MIQNLQSPESRSRSEPRVQPEATCHLLPDAPGTELGDSGEGEHDMFEGEWTASEGLGTRTLGVVVFGGVGTPPVFSMA